MYMFAIGRAIDSKVAKGRQVRLYQSTVESLDGDIVV